MARQHVRDHDSKQREGETDADPEPSRHAVKLGIGFGGRNRHWLERHTADRAISRLVAHDLRMHGARVLRVGSGCADRLRLQSHSTLRAAAGARRLHFRMHRTGEHHHLAIMHFRIA